ncbi:MAG: 3'-5' exonuclease [bacterium]|nr:3'-5' exonuclease [bacterium]
MFAYDRFNNMLFQTPSQTLKRLFAYLRNHGGVLHGSQAVKRALNLRGKPKEFYVDLSAVLFGQTPDIFERLSEDEFRIRPIEQFNIPLGKATYAVVDIETTGGKPPQERVTEIAALRIDGKGRELSKFSTLVNPRKKIPPYVVRHTKISDSMVKSAPTIDEVIPQLMILLEGNILVVHDSFADMQFLDYDCDRLYSGLLALPLLNTQHLAERFCPGLGGLGLNRIAEHLNIHIGERHRALVDAELTVQVLTHFLAELNDQTIYDVYLNGSPEASYIRPGPSVNGKDNNNCASEES